MRGDHDVVDAKGRKSGVLGAIYVDTTTDEPAVATGRTGLPTRQRQVFVPLDEAVLGQAVKVSYAKSLARKAPSIGTADMLPAEQEKGICQHYGMTYQPGVKGELQLARR